jgi:hypothetical protein
MKLTMVRLPRWQLPLRSSFAPTMRRNQLSGSASSWLSLPRQESSHKSSGTPILLASLPKQVLWDILDTVDVCNESDPPFDLLKDVLLGQFGKSKSNPILNCFGSPWKCRASSPAFSWENSSSIPSWCQSRHRSVSLHFFNLTTAFHARGSRCWKPQDSRGDG